MKTKLFTLLLVAAAATSLRSQSINYTYLHDDPYDMKNFSLSLDPFWVEANGHNGYAFGWGLRGEHMMGKRLLANADFRTGFGTNLYRKSNDNTRNYNNFEGGLGFIFYNKMKRKNVPIILSQTTSGNTKTTYYIKGGVPANCRLIVALRGGMGQYLNSLNYDKMNDTLFTMDGAAYKTAKSGSAFIDTTGSGNASVAHVGGIAITSFYGGIQFRNIRNLLIDVDGWGVRGNILYSDFYIDVLFAPVIGIKDFKNPDGTEYKVDYTEKAHLGWRFGWFARKPKDQGFSMKFEVGSRPGFKAPKNTSVPLNKQNLYGMFTFGLYIPLKIQPMYTGE